MKFADLINYVDHVLNFRLFQIQQTPVTVASLLMFLLVVVVFLILSRVVCGIFL